MELQGDGYAKSASRSRQENLLSSIYLEVALILIKAAKGLFTSSIVPDLTVGAKSHL